MNVLREGGEPRFSLPRNEKRSFWQKGTIFVSNPQEVIERSPRTNRVHHVRSFSGWSLDEKVPLGSLPGRPAIMEARHFDCNEGWWSTAAGVYGINHGIDSGLQEAFELVLGTHGTVFAGLDLVL